MYADNTTLSYPSKDVDELNDILNRDLGHLKQWLQGNKLSLNVIQKISAKKVQPPSFVIGDSPVEIAEKVKHLRVQLDQHLVWDEHTRVAIVALVWVAEWWRLALQKLQN